MLDKTRNPVIPIGSGRGQRSVRGGLKASYRGRAVRSISYERCKRPPAQSPGKYDALAGKSSTFIRSS